MRIYENSEIFLLRFLAPFTRVFSLFISVACHIEQNQLTVFNHVFYCEPQIFKQVIYKLKQTFGDVFYKANNFVYVSLKHFSFHGFVFVSILSTMNIFPNNTPNFFVFYILTFYVMAVYLFFSLIGLDVTNQDFLSIRASSFYRFCFSRAHQRSPHSKNYFLAIPFTITYQKIFSIFRLRL